MADRTPIPHRILKVRTVQPPRDLAPDHAAAWLEMTPFPPGTAPVFQCSLWFWCDETLGERSPVLRVGPARATGAAGDDPGNRGANLWASPKFAVRTFQDRSPGWRRVDFHLTLTGQLAAELTVHVTKEPDGTKPYRVLLGRLRLREGRWSYQPRKEEPANPFLQAELADRALGTTVFVGGAPKSGTTWMLLLLNQHPEVMALGEGLLTNMARLETPRPVNQWFPARMSAKQLHDFASEMLIDRMVALYRSAFQCRVIADKTPGNTRQSRYLLKLLPEAKLIHCIRHPLDVVISRLHHELALMGGRQTKPAGFVGDGRALRSLAPALAAGDVLPLSRPDLWPMVLNILDEWAVFQEEALISAAAFPDRMLLSRYEDMLADGVGAAQRVFKHLGVSAALDVVQQCVRATSFSAIKGSAIAGEGGAQFFRKGTAGQFEQVVSPADRDAAFTHLRSKLPTLGQLGYEAAIPVAA